VSLDPVADQSLVRGALDEDLGGGRDITTEALVPPEARARGLIVAREPFVVAGLPLAREVFRQLDAGLIWTAVDEGAEAAAGDTIASVEGAARPILTGERTALNFLQRLCGIATQARIASKEVEGTGAVVLDTRKTTPMLRAAEKHAVAIGGASNHRMGLHDAVLIKDNHVALAGGVGRAMALAREAGLRPGDIEIEVSDLREVGEALEAGAGRILLDNVTPEEAREAVRMVAGRAIVECSGGLRPGFLRPYALAGADYLSLGWLTHSARAADISMEVQPIR